MNRYLFVYGELHQGGIETLIVRTANQLATMGKDVAVVGSEGPLSALLAEGVTMIGSASREAMREGARAWLAKSADPVAMLSFDPISTARGLSIETMRDKLPPITHLAGAFHPRAYFMAGERRDRIMLNRLVAAAVGFNRLFFQNAECRAGHERQWQRTLDPRLTLPPAVEIREPAWQARDSKNLKLVSVGRLVDFKAYNLGAAEIARDCLDRGIALSWDIYGSGPLANAMAEEIARQGVAEAVRLKGELPYPRFAETVVAHDLFVGCGTSALEAAMLGLPVLSVTDSERRATYGFFDGLPFGNTGELQDEPPTQDLAALVVDYANMDQAGRRKLGERCRQAALAYGLPAMIERLEAMVAGAGRAPPPAFKRLVALVYEAMTASTFARLARRIRG